MQGEEVVCVPDDTFGNDFGYGDHRKIPAELTSSLVSGEKTDFSSAENKESERKSHQSVDRGTLTLNLTIEYDGHNYRYKE